jgi:PAS domain S-box-containing protein
MNLLSRENLRIVQVEDSDDYARITASILQRAGFRQPVVRFGSGSEALEYLWEVEASRAPHLILLDLKMPGIGGIEMLRWLRLNYCEPDVAIYILTTSDDPHDRKLAACYGANEYLLKSTAPRRLLEVLDAQMDQYNHRRLHEIRKLQDDLAELALLSESTDEMIVLTDTEGRIEWVNEPFTHMCGFSLHELRGQKPSQMLRGPATDPAVVDRLRETIASAGECECEIVNYTKSGKPYRVSISMGPVISGGCVDGFLAVERDITDKAQLPPPPVRFELEPSSGR